MVLADPLVATRVVARALETLGVRYLVGGSLASSLHGVPRSTQDADLVADLGMAHAQRFVELLGDEFYADLDTIRDAIRRRSSFNVIYLPTMFKVDVFVARRDPFSQLELDRRQLHSLDEWGGGELPIATAEDIVLHKLDWYRRGGGVSDRQWGDALGVARVNARDLDLAYLEEWAERIGVDDLLAKLLAEAGIRRAGS